MTYWARVQRDGPWLESELLIRADSFEVRPLVATIPTRTVAYTTVTGVHDADTDPPAAERTVEIATSDDVVVGLRGPLHGIEVLVAAFTAEMESTPTPAPTPVRVPAPAPAPTPTWAHAPTLAPSDTRPAPPSATRPPEEPTTRDGPTGAAYAVAIVCAAVFIVLLGIWNHSSNQRELRDLAHRMHVKSTTPEITTSTPPPQVLGDTTIAPSPASPEPASTIPTTTPPPTTTTATTTTTTRPSSTHPATTTPPAVPSGPRLLLGAVSLRQVQHWTDTPPECRGLGQLSDVTVGTPVVVRDASGKPIALGTLGECQFVESGFELAQTTPKAQTDGAVGGIPRFTVEIPDIPDSDRYTVQVGRYDPVRFSRAEIGAGTWRMQMLISAG